MSTLSEDATSLRSSSGWHTLVTCTAGVDPFKLRLPQTAGELFFEAMESCGAPQRVQRRMSCAIFLLEAELALLERAQVY